MRSTGPADLLNFEEGAVDAQVFFDAETWRLLRALRPLGPERPLPREPRDQGVVAMTRLLPCSPSLLAAAALTTAAATGRR